VQEQSWVLHSRTECRQALTVNGMLPESCLDASDLNCSSFIIHDENLHMQTNEILQAEIWQYNCREKIEQLLEAANWAPTHGKTEPWRWVVLSEDGLQDMIKVTDQVWPCKICQQHVICIICIQHFPAWMYTDSFQAIVVTSL